MINNRFQILEKLGEGRSRVYKCTDLWSGYTYAIKIISPSLSEEEYNKFANEYYTIQKLNHPGIIKAYEYGTVFESLTDEIIPGSRFILLEYFDGEELAGRKELTEDGLRKIIIQISAVLQYLHQSYYIYYDLKPENILISGAENNPVLKLIDFGFARTVTGDIESPGGTAEYIAPELLKKEPHDHRVDYYSFGILLYKLVYGCFPFDNSAEIKIFRAQLEDNFEFTENNYSPEINKIMQKLLQKDPELRYLYTMQIYAEIGYTADPDIVSSWVPAKQFSGRDDIINILGSYLINYSGGDVFVIKGSEGSGKSALLQEFAERNPGIIVLENAKTVFGLDFIKDFLERVLYNENVYLNISAQLRENIKEFVINPPNNIIDEVKGFFSQITRSCRFILLVDDFNFLDELSLELFRNIIPLLQVHNIKLVLTENSDKPYITNFIHNQHQLNLSPFTDVQLQDYFEKSFYSYYPREELKKTILLYADLLPGSIESFIRDLVISGIIKYTTDGIRFISNEDTIGILKQSHDDFYKMRISVLSDEELYLAQFLAAFNNIPDGKFISEIFDNYSHLLVSLRNKNILHISGDLKTISFTSAGMKQYVYNIIPEKKNFHIENACMLISNTPGNIMEIAYQYETAGEFQKSLEYYRQLFNEASKIDAYNYQKTLLEHIITFQVDEYEKNNLKFELCRVLQKTGDYVSALEVCNELLLFVSDPDMLNELLLLKGLCLIGSGNPEEGVKQIEHLVDILEDEKRKQHLQTEIASACLDLNNFEKAEEICREIIAHNHAASETKAQCNNLLGIISIHRDNDFENACDFFQSSEQIYSSAGIKFGTAQMQLNLANIKSLRGEPAEAEKLFQSSLELNSSVGNLKHEATALLNIGVHHMEYSEYDKSSGYYKKALSIFSNTGDLRGEALINTNLGEIYYLTCKYREALTHLDEARRLFQKIQDANEECESLFLTGKIFVELGSNENLNKIITQYDKLLKNQGAKHEVHNRLLKLLAKKKSLNFFHEIKDIIRYYSAQRDTKNFFRASVIVLKFLYDHQLYKEALEQVTNNELVEASKFNKYFEAEWNLLFGMIINETGNHDVHPSEYFLKAYEIVENLSISELTWKIMITLSEFYYKRGNYLRAEEFAYYTKNLIEYISGNIGDDSLTKSYMAKKDIKDTLNLCRKILKGHG
jgi:serine/threonine protein kinase